MSKAYNGLRIVPGSRILDNMDDTQFFYTKLIHGLEIIGHFEMKAKSSSNCGYLGRPKCQKKSDIQQNLLFEDPGWERIENLKYRNFW